MTAVAGRLPLIDGLKLAAAQFIVLHHLSVYGPLAEGLRALAPSLAAWLFAYGRMAVQVFLVLGGYLAARSLSRETLARESLSGLLARRYLRLALPLMAALALAMGAATLARPWLDSELVGAVPSLAQLLAHALMLHGLLGYESLSAGVWYVAIDLQLYAVLAGLLWAGRERPLLARGLVLALMLAALFVFNLDASLDNWALYFFGAYGLGVAFRWAERLRRPGWGLALLSLLACLALAYEFRERLLVALSALWLLALGLRWRAVAPNGWRGALQRLLALGGQSSYSLFLVHFPVCLLVNAAFEALAPDAPRAGWILGALALAWLLSQGAGLAFYRWVEQPAGRLRWGLPSIGRA